MGTFLQKTQVCSSNSSNNSISASPLPYQHQLSHFYDLSTRFKRGWRLPFYPMNYWSIVDSKQLLTSSFIIESQNQAKNIAISHRNLEVTSVNQWHTYYRIISPYQAKLLNQALTCLSTHSSHLMHGQEWFYGSVGSHIQSCHLQYQIPVAWHSNSVAVLGLSWDYLTTQYSCCKVYQNASVVVDLSICGTIHKLWTKMFFFRFEPLLVSLYDASYCCLYIWVFLITGLEYGMEWSNGKWNGKENIATQL